MDDDLTASHWDDVLSPSQQQFSLNYSINNHFADLAVNPHKDSSDEENEEDDNDSKGENEETDAETAAGFGRNNFDNSAPGGYSGGFQTEVHHAYGSTYNHGSAHQTEIEQLNEIQREERKEHKAHLLSELTSGTGDEDLEKSLSPSKPTADSLFDSLAAPIPILDFVASPEKRPIPKASKLKGALYRLRVRKFSSKSTVQHLADPESASGDPLGPLGVTGTQTNDEKEPKASDHGADKLIKEVDAPLYDIQSDETEPDPESRAARPEGVPKKNSENDLEISVSDPVKIGDIATAHVVYSIRAKNKNEQSRNFPSLHETTAARRYKDFRWIYHQLQNNHPGIIIPPPPTKQTYVGRFNENFIENRRLSLEKMLMKISRIHILANDPDFVMFLTSEDFANESKERENVSGSGASSRDGEEDDDNSSTLSTAVSIVSGTAPASFMSSLFSSSNKIVETDEFFTKKKAYIDDLQHNLKSFARSLELIANQRLETIALTEEIATALDELSDLEILKSTTSLLGAFAEVHHKLKESLDRVNLQDQLTLGLTVEEYLRIIGSVKHVFDTRIKVNLQYSTFKLDLAKKQEVLDRMTAKYKASPEKINTLKFEVEKLKQKVDFYEKSFKAISETIKVELHTFELEKIEDFRNSVEIFIEGSIESQKEAIELWETFYERQNLGLV